MVDVNVGTTEKVLGGVLLPPVWDGGHIAKMLVVFWCNFPLTDLGVVLDPLLHRVLVEFHQTHLHELRKDHLPPPHHLHETGRAELNWDTEGIPT